MQTYTATLNQALFTPPAGRTSNGYQFTFTKTGAPDIVILTPLPEVVSPPFGPGAYYVEGVMVDTAGAPMHTPLTGSFTVPLDKILMPESMTVTLTTA